MYGLYDWRSKIILRNNWRYIVHKGYCSICKRRSILLGCYNNGVSTVCANPKCKEYSVYKEVYNERV